MTLAPQAVRTHDAYMTTGMEDGVCRALEIAPGSLRALAKEAGVSEGLLRHIRDRNQTATPETVEAVAAALERLSHRHRDDADRENEAALILRDALSAWRRE